MAEPPSLPSTSSTSNVTIIHTVRPVDPIPITTQQFYKPRARTSSNSTRSRSGSLASIQSHQRQLSGQPREPPSRSFSYPAPPQSATHIGSIMPPASFFRPSKPNHPVSPIPQPRPSSFASASSSSTPILKRQPDPTQLSIKPSREALLPISEKNRPSAETSQVGGVRGSLERIFKRNPDSTHHVIHPQEEEMSDFSPSKESHHARHSVTSRSSDLPSPRHQPITQPPSARPTLTISPLSRFPITTMPVVQLSSERNYESYPSRNTFFCRGHLLTGGDIPPLAFIVSLLIVFSIAGVWFGTTCVWWWNNESPAVAGIGAYLCLITVASLLATALRDPGILPRDLDPDPPYPPTSSSPSDGSPRAPLPRDLKWRSSFVRVKYCTTCRTYRPPRSSHCKLCDNCVDGCDHHCQWVNNCVGRRNYTCFITFLLASTTTLFLVIVTSALHIYFVSSRESLSIRDALSAAAGSAVAFSESILVLWPLLALLFYHMRLLLLNISTIEQIRNQAHASLIPGPPPPNPFTLNKWYRNLAYLLCRPAGYSWIDPSGYVEIDNRLPNPGWKRSVNDPEVEGERWGNN